MALPNMKDALRNATLGAALIAAPMTAQAPALAQDAQVQMQQAAAQSGQARSNLRSLSSAMRQASNYSSSTGGIGIVVYYGSGNGISADDLGQRFVDGIQRRGAQARYFVVPSNAEGASLAFHIDDTARGPMNVTEAVSRIDEIVALRGIRNRTLAAATMD